MKFCALLILLLLTGCVNAPQSPSNDDLKGSAVWLLTKEEKGWAGCGGVAVAADTFRTAKHCVADGVLYSVNGQPVTVAGITYRGSDVAEVKLSAPMFKRWAKVGPLPKQGDRIRWWGNPKGIRDVYRQGYVVAVTDSGLIAVDAMVCHGDSGSGMWNDKGELVGVISMMQPEVSKCTFAVGEA